MQELVSTINNITKYGLQPNLNVADKEADLEKELIKIYSLCLQVDYEFDEAEYPDFDIALLPDLRKNIASNFKDYGYYKTPVDLNDLENLEDISVGDAIDDLVDIIRDLLEVKWRIENNSLADGLWFFKFIFWAHTQQHMLDLLNYMKQKNR